MTLSRLAARTIFLACVLLVGGNAFAAEGIAEKAKLCATCHGEQGIPINKTTPVIWGRTRAISICSSATSRAGPAKTS